MRSLSTLLLALASTALSLPSILSPVAITPAQGPKQDGSYIVKLGEGVDKDATIKTLVSKLNLGPNVITHNYDSKRYNAFVGNFPKSSLPIVQVQPGVEAIYEDAIMSIAATQTDATWGLERVSKRGLVSGSDPTSLTYTYTYPYSAGQGVDIYVVDTGINIEHETFQGRAHYGFAAPPYPNANDGHGHGTHCAGTAAGWLHGVAKSAEVFAVKVLSDQGSGPTSDIMAGVLWAVANSETRPGRPGVVSMSLGGGADDVMDTAVRIAHGAGLHVVVAAGNSNVNAEGVSPARVPEITTVGAITINDVKAKFSNYGNVVDIWAPGQGITSAWIGSTNAINNISGTSMATPHVSGLYALYLAEYGQMYPTELSDLFKRQADVSADGLPVAQVSYGPI